MITKSKNTTNIITDIPTIGDEKYTYLFRTWRALLTTASSMLNIWINNYHTKIQDIRRKHTILSRNKSAFEDDQFEDDLPKFLKSISEDELEEMIEQIEANMVQKKDAICKMYTVHGYKGLEDNNIRVASDIELDDEEEDKNIFYVALTRGMKYIIMDNISMINNGPEINNINAVESHETIRNEIISGINQVQMRISDYFR
jgi:superfamily I DNA/RNA helicase